MATVRYIVALGLWLGLVLSVCSCRSVYLYIIYFIKITIIVTIISPRLSMAVLQSVLALSLALVLSVCRSVCGNPGVPQELDYGGVPLWINRLLEEPSVLSLRGWLD